MVEIILVLSLVYGFVMVLMYLHYKDKEEKEYVKKLQSDLTNLPLNMQKFYAEISRKDQERQQKIVTDTFTKYLAHIERLERMTLPKQVSEKEVKTVLERVGELADETVMENEIESEKEKGVELPGIDWAGLINANTKVAFEEDDAPTIVE